MIRRKKFLILISLSLGLFTSVSAKNVKIEEINANLESIQVAALKEEKNILSKNKLFISHDTFIEYAAGFTKYYIVNIKKEEYLHTLGEVKMLYPSAFRASQKIKKLLNKAYIPDQKQTRHSSQDNDLLNTDSILKTRKKFF